MRRLVLPFFLALVLGACGDPAGEHAEMQTTAPSEGFTLTGTVTDVRTGVEVPESAHGEDHDAGTGARPGGQRDDEEEGTVDEGGVLEIEASGDAEGLDDCDADGDTYSVYYTEQTRFDAEVTEDEESVDVLKDAEVTASGSVESDDGDCTLIAEQVSTEAGGARDEAAGRAPGGDFESPTPEPAPQGGATPGVGEPEGSPRGNR